jgi:hypothetical protein
MKLAATATFRLMASTDTMNRRKRMMFCDCLVLPRRTVALLCTRTPNWPQWTKFTQSRLRLQRRSWPGSGAHAHGRPYLFSRIGLAPPPWRAPMFCLLNSIAGVWCRRQRGAARLSLVGGHRRLSVRRDSGLLHQQGREEAPSDFHVLRYEPMYQTRRR